MPMDERIPAVEGNGYLEIVPGHPRIDNHKLGTAESRLDFVVVELDTVIKRLQAGTTPTVERLEEIRDKVKSTIELMEDMIEI